MSARGLRPTRFRGLAQLERVTVEQLAHLFDLSKARAAHLLPEVGVQGKRAVDEIVTSLHQLDVVHATARDLATLPANTPFESVVDYKLANGLRVLLAPDPDSVGVDARLVISGAGGGGILERLPTQAAMLLSEDDGKYESADAAERVRWYQRIGASVLPTFDEHSTTFSIRGVGTFADWHVWHLAWLVLYGHYPSSCDDNPLCPPEADSRGKSKTKQPSAFAVATRRLSGLADAEPLTIFSEERLESYRRSIYRR